MRMDWKKLGIALVALAPVVGGAQDEPSDPVTEYQTLLRETRGLERYNALRRRQIAMQQQSITDLQAAIGEVPALQVQLPPLLIDMVEGLDEFVELDLPFLRDMRTDRIANLYELIEEPTAPDAQKLRRIFEAWAIEIEYGNEVQTDTGEVMIDGQPRAVDFVILGRIGILYQTSDDEALTGAWDHESGEWVELGSEHRNQVRQAIRMARSQVAPDLLLLPIVPPSQP